MPKHVWFVSLMAICLWMMACGCTRQKSEGIYPVRGSVIVNGVPAEYANVLFVPKDPDGLKASGVVGADGEFQLTTQREFDGAAPGEYSVTISWAKPKNPNAGEPDYGPELLPKSFQDPLKSGLSANIEPTNNILEPFDLKVK